MIVHLMKAFVESDGRGGNTAAVVLDADGLDGKRRQAIARELAVSETAFVVQRSERTADVHFYTPWRQIAHCGHATVATYALLRQLDRIGDGVHTKISIDGPRSVQLADGMVWLRQSVPRIEARSDWRDALADMLQLSPDAMCPMAPVIVDVGNRFLHLAVRDRQTLDDVVPQRAKVAAFNEQHGLIGLYVSTDEVAVKGRHASARMFAPNYGIDEEPATGMAAGGLGVWLADRSGRRNREFLIEQGRGMSPPSPSLLRVKVGGAGSIDEVWTGGRAAAERKLPLPRPLALPDETANNNQEHITCPTHSNY